MRRRLTMALAAMAVLAPASAAQAAGTSIGRAPANVTPQALLKGVKVPFTCARACTVKGSAKATGAELGLPGGQKAVVARGEARLRRRGKGALVLRLTTPARQALQRCACSPGLAITATAQPSGGRPITRTQTSRPAAPAQQAPPPPASAAPPAATGCKGTGDGSPQPGWKDLKDDRLDPSAYVQPTDDFVLGTWDNLTVPGQFTTTADCAYTSPNGGSGTWHIEGDIVAFTGALEGFCKGHARAVTRGNTQYLEFNCSDPDGYMYYFSHAKKGTY